MKPNSRAYNRDVSRRKALRKRRLDGEVHYNGKEYPFYNNLHQYSKNKIHCSCSLCSAKTRNKKRTWGRKISYTISDQRKIDALEFTDD